ncbi:MAG TPA: 2,3-bisphosphoglycerate-independent phosphoglycerate mutase [Solirubrobacteraceae bacterium]|jgi:2,3-bisphosphoglycerate-independent phosphoglycerate mutase|nr:2,3-bisphosphoglycerate-independent phosphoglycerate mutase [Solirubrobacteraceae bacterium]
MTAAADSRAAPARSVCLVVLDGWGLAPAGPGNAVSLARTPVFDELWATCPHTTLTAWGVAVGLPEGQMGNSEVGHLNLGAGAIVKQDLVRIDEAIADGTLARNGVLRAAFADAASAGASGGSDAGYGGGSGVVPPSPSGPVGLPPRVHLLGLVSDGGVHSSLEHLRALIALAGEIAPAAEVIVHAFTDGRDTLPHAGAGYLSQLDRTAGARVGSVVGRYWAMDRDRRWDRIQRAYDLLLHGRGPYRAQTGEQAVREAYERGETDEFIEPTLVGEDARIRPGDSVVCFNFRPDRMREIVRALAEPGFGEQASEQLPGWEGRGGAVPVSRLATLTEYEEGWPYPVAFAPERPEVTLSEVIARSGARQLHVAETEKYPHVTYFFNGGEETPCEGERRELVASPRDVPTYDHKPQMSAREAAAAFVAAWGEGCGGGAAGEGGGAGSGGVVGQGGVVGKDDEGTAGESGYRFGVINFANADMVGHTGVIAAAVAAIETVDECLGVVLRAVRESGGVCVVTADHGNADHMLEPDGSPNTAHSLNPVPLIVTAPDLRLRAQGGILADVAPTVLDLLAISQPPQMTGRSLIEDRVPAA